jgi:hypothetical protein
MVPGRPLYVGWWLLVSDASQWHVRMLMGMVNAGVTTVLGESIVVEVEWGLIDDQTLEPGECGRFGISSVLSARIVGEGMRFRGVVVNCARFNGLKVLGRVCVDEFVGVYSLSCTVFGRGTGVSSISHKF